MRINLSRLLHDEIEHLLRTAHKHHRFLASSIILFHILGTLFLQFVHLESKEIPASDTFLRLTLGMNPLTCLHDTHPIRNQDITT